jgi:hypothetical protein
MTSLGDLHGLYQLQGFAAAAPRSVLRHELHTPRTQQLFGVTHHIGSTPTAPGDRAIAVFGRVSIFRKPAALRRAWIVHRVRRVRDDAGLRAAIQDPAVDMSTTALTVADIAALQQCAGEGDVLVEQPGPNSLRLKASLNCQGLVVVSDVDFPGWRATIDGISTPIHEVNGSMRGVVAQPGEHLIEMRYEPYSVLVGTVMTVFGLAAALFIGTGAHRRALPGFPKIVKPRNRSLRRRTDN